MHDIKRLFTFGCSFTGYRWATWANILGYDLGCEFYNFGISGAGNTYIANTLSQADAYFNFNKNDLVAVAWTNISREDRWGIDGWVTPGNIYTQHEYDNNFVKNWANEFHFALRDFSHIHYAKNLLENKKTNYKFIAMCDISNQLDQWSDKDLRNYEHPMSKISRLYDTSLQTITHNFYDVLWQSNIKNKFKKDWKEIHKHYSDGHPTPLEHFEFLQTAFNHRCSSKTEKTVKRLHYKWANFIRKSYSNTRGQCGIHELSDNVRKTLLKDFRLRIGNTIPDAIFH